MSSSEFRAAASRARPLALAALLGMSLAASAATYMAPSGYFQIVGYKLQRVERDGKPELSVAGWVQALADCRGAMLLFEVRARDGKPVGTLRISHGAFFRHDRWGLGPGTFTPQGDAAAAITAADHVVVREAECVP
jgi:hypothetical protein